MLATVTPAYGLLRLMDYRARVVREARTQDSAGERAGVSANGATANGTGEG